MFWKSSEPAEINQFLQHLTTASLVISAGGVAVAKHGNRAASSKSGAADCLEALGVKIDLEPEKNKEVLEKLGICFLFAQKYHMSMKYVAPVRKMLGIRPFSTSSDR